MKKYRNTIILIILSLLTVVVLFSCTDKEPEEKLPQVEYTPPASNLLLDQKNVVWSNHIIKRGSYLDSSFGVYYELAKAVKLYGGDYYYAVERST